MLTIQRASAGSGKTYSLARTFLLNLISTQHTSNPDNPQANKRELIPTNLLPAALRSILAITFTNKATDEMKSRIVEKLYALARWTPEIPTSDVDYLDDFSKLYGWKPEEIQKTCSAALDTILESYSDLNVSTIDSFFQNVLRNFTYEIKLHDNYQVKIDNEEITREALLNTIQKLQGTSKNKADKFISDTLKTLIKKYSQANSKWNILKDASSGGDKTQSSSLYDDIRNALARMDSDGYKKVLPELDNYFNSLSSDYEFDQTIEAMQNLAVGQAEKHLQAARTIAKLTLNIISEQGPSVGIKDFKDGRASLVTYLKEILKKEGGKRCKDVIKDPQSPFQPMLPDSLVPSPKPKCNVSFSVLLTETKRNLELINTELAEYLKLRTDPKYYTWNAIGDSLPLLALMRRIGEDADKMLRENNAIKLADTDNLLAGLISNDNTPFIYERLGTRLRHFLIDEFQDTSERQWEIISPLVEESQSQESPVSNNLIIGDAKQSIYGFRDADPSLITTIVPEQFASSDLLLTDDSETYNSNFRSAHNIVKFNNSYFKHLAAKLDEFDNTVYQNIVQHPKSKDLGGYIELRKIAKSKENNESANGILLQIGEIIDDILSRGFKQRDIAILVNTHVEEAKIVETLKAYNNLPERNEKNKPTIEFVSESALKVNSSAAVQAVVSVLKAIAKGHVSKLADTSDEAQQHPTKSIPWDKIALEFTYFVTSHPELSNSDSIQQFLDNQSSGAQDRFQAVAQLLEALPTLTLPALTEGIIEKFIPSDLRNSSAPYLSAFQDIVLEYCSSNPSDINSFLNYWDTYANTLGIPFPENANAVQILTIHKSKGLEFKCVIIPKADKSYEFDELSKTTWRWLPLINFDEKEVGHKLPPFVPVKMMKSLLNTGHNPGYGKEFENFCQQTRLERLNLEYVAFTRAVCELYVFYTGSRQQDRCSRTLLNQKKLRLNTDAKSDIPWFSYNLPDKLCDPDLCLPDCDNDNWILSIGEKYLTAPVKKNKASGFNILPEPEQHLIEDYPATASKCLLTFSPRFNDSAHISNLIPDEENPDDNDADPRAYGSLMHSILQDVYTIDDLPRALRRAEISGRFPYEFLMEAKKLLETQLLLPEVNVWFNANNEIFNEQPFWFRPQPDKPIEKRIPDRICRTPEGKVYIIDYKFGLAHNKESRRRYENQLREYAKILRDAGFASDMECYLWYMRQNPSIHPVTL